MIQKIQAEDYKVLSAGSKVHYAIIFRLTSEFWDNLLVESELADIMEGEEEKEFELEFCCQLPDLLREGLADVVKDDKIENTDWTNLDDGQTGVILPYSPGWDALFRQFSKEEVLKCFYAVAK